MAKKIEIENDSVSLKEVITVLLIHWKVILATVCVFVVPSLIYMILYTQPAYESTIDGIISIPEKVETRYGEYFFPSQNPKDYTTTVFSDQMIRKMIHREGLKWTTADFKRMIRLEQEEESNRFLLKLVADSPEKAKDTLQLFSKYYLNEINYISKQNALSYFERYFNTSLVKIASDKENFNEKIKSYEVLIKDVDRVLPLKKIMLSDPVYAAKIAREKSINLENLSDEMMFEEYVNPNYEALELQIIDLKKELANTEIQERQNLKFIEEIRTERTALTTFLFEDTNVKLNDGMLEVLRPYVLINGQATLPEVPLPKGRLMKLVVALISGLSMGIFIALFIGYWKNEMHTK